MTNRAIAHARLRNSRLVGPPLATPEAVVEWFGAVQSQDVPGALWGLAQRMARGAGPTIEAIGAAMDEGRVVRTHAMRPTWHFLVPADLRWIQALTGPRVQRAIGTMSGRLGLAPADFARAVSAMRSAMRGGAALTRAELRAVVATVGIDGSDNLAIGVLGMHAELEAVICNGPRRGKDATYALVDERIPPVPRMAQEDALRELTIRYFRSHGPALAHDMAWWSGLRVSDVRRGIELAGLSLDGRRIDGRDYWAAAGALEADPDQAPAPHVLLLPNYDEYLGSYVDYGPVMDEALPRPRGVNDVLGAHIVVRDGLVVGGWRRRLAPGRATLTVTLLIRLASAELDALGAAADAFGRFVGLPVDLRVAMTDDS
jgi:hypothetical protein